LIIGKRQMSGISAILIIVQIAEIPLTWRWTVINIAEKLLTWHFNNNRYH
jgi:hypothetical protein